MKKILFFLLCIYLFVNTKAQTISEIQMLRSSDYASGDMFGTSVSVSGDYYIAGAREEDEDENGSNTVSNAGSAYIFKKISGNWIQTQKIVAPDRNVDDRFGSFVSISGDFAAVTATYNGYDQNNQNFLSSAGAVYVYRNISDNWVFFQKIVPPLRTANQQFGSSLKIVGNYLYIGAMFDKYDSNDLNQVSGAGAVYIYEFDNTQWNFSQKITASIRNISANFGYSLDVFNDYLFVSANLEKYDQNNSNLANGAGAGYIFQRISGQYQFIQKVVAPDRAEYDRLGAYITGNEQFLVIGANTEDEDALGGNTLIDAGSAYIFKNVSNDWQFFQKIVQPDRTAGKKFGEKITISGNDLFFGVSMEDKDTEGNNSLSQAGALYYFKFNDTYWEFNQKFVPSDRAYAAAFGSSLDYENQTIIVGALTANKTYVLNFDIFDFSQPNDASCCENSEAVFETNSDQAQTFQWQIFINSLGWFDISDNENYSGTNTGILNIANTPFAFNNNKYRCLLSNGVLTKYTNEANLTVDTLIVSNVGENIVLCDLNNVELNANNPYPNTGYWTSENQDVIFSNSTLYNTTVNNLPTVENVLTWTIDNGLCGLSYSTLTTIFDMISPVTPTLANVSGECSVIVSETPTTTDNCAGEIIGTTTDPTEYTEQGTYTITWTFDDGNGNSTTALQTVIIDDVTSPVTPILADLTDECSVTATAPTTTDNCAGTISGTTTDPTEYTEQGTYTITWTFADGNGNSIDVEQTVIIDDVTDPTIECIENLIINLNEGETFYTVQASEFAPTSTDDNCEIESVINNFNNLATLENAQLPIGLTTIIWTVTDIAGNTETCSFEITVNAFVGLETLQQKGIWVYPNPTNGIVNFEFANNSIQKLTISDITGKQIIEKTVIQQNEQIDLSGFVNGIYIISIQTDNEIFTSKIIKE